jgi:hypothetical protein
MKAWWVTAREYPNGDGWNWANFFRSAKRSKGPYQWGGSQWIRSHSSFKCIARMRKGDIVVANQSGVGVVGFVRLANDPVADAKSGVFNVFELRTSGFVRLDVSIPFGVIRKLPAAAENFDAVRFHQTTVSAVTPRGLWQLGHLAAALNPRLRSRTLALAGR